MSLINEALKKAQKQRQDEAAAQAGLILPPGMMRGGTIPPTPPPADGGHLARSSGTPDPALDPIQRARQAHRSDESGNLLRWTGGAFILAVVLAFGWWLRRPTAVADEPIVAGAEQLAAGDSAPTPMDATPAVAAAAAPTDSVVASMPTDLPSADVSAAEPVAIAITEREPAVTMPQSAVEPVSPTNPVVAADMVTPSASVSDRDPAGAPRGGAPLVIAPAAVSFAATTPDAVPADPVPAPNATDESSVVRTVRPAAAGSVTILAKDDTKPSAWVESTAVTGAAVANEAILAFLERARVTGVRVSASDPKVLMNDRVYRLNEMVDRDLKLRVISIRDRELQFRDPQGYVYTKSF